MTSDERAHGTHDGSSSTDDELLNRRQRIGQQRSHGRTRPGPRPRRTPPPKHSDQASNRGRTVRLAISLAHLALAVLRMFRRRR